MAAPKKVAAKKAVAKKKDYRSNDLAPLKEKLGTAKISASTRKAYLAKGDETMRENSRSSGQRKVSLPLVKSKLKAARQNKKNDQNVAILTAQHLRVDRRNQRGA